MSCDSFLFVELRKFKFGPVWHLHFPSGGEFLVVLDNLLYALSECDRVILGHHRSIQFGVTNLFGDADLSGGCFNLDGSPEIHNRTIALIGHRDRDFLDP